MPGWLTNGVGAVGPAYGSERFSIDTELSGGVQPQTASISLQHLAALMDMLSNFADITPVAGSRYFVGVDIGFSRVLTGIQTRIGSVGGTDKLIYELHDPNGVLVATTATAGVTVGTANSYQQIPFTAQYTAAPGRYFLAIQNNGTTARLSAYNAPSTPLVTGSATGTFGTGAAITPPTTYTAGVGPIALLY